MAVLISILVLFYSSWLGTAIYYFVKMPKLGDVDKKLKLTGKTVLFLLSEQLLALVVEWIYLTVTMNGVHVTVPGWVAVTFAVLFGVGMVAWECFYFFYIGKQFPECRKKGKLERKYWGLDARAFLVVGIAIFMMNFWFHVFAACAVVHVVK